MTVNIDVDNTDNQGSNLSSRTFVLDFNKKEAYTTKVDWKKKIQSQDTQVDILDPKRRLWHSESIEV